MDWADREGWNPGLHDAEAFFTSDPNGFFTGEIAAVLIASASLVKYPGDLSFAGLLIVRKDMRGQGVGSKMINICSLKVVVGTSAVTECRPCCRPMSEKGSDWPIGTIGSRAGAGERLPRT